jgi:uncharacterized membrane protein
MAMQPSAAPRSTPIGLATPLPHIRTIDEADLSWALSQGWKDFQEKRGDVILLALLYPLIGFIAAAASFNAWLTPMFFPMVAGISILGPAVATGFYEIARRREAGLDTSWWHLFDPLRGRSRMGLAELTAGLVAIFLLWLVAASLIYAATLGALHPAGVGDFLRRLISTPRGWTLIVVGNLVGFVFAAATLIYSFVSFPMVVDKPVDGLTALTVSLRAVAANPRMTAAWGLQVAGLLLIGALPAFIGLAVVLPVLGYATWHLYTCVVER